MPVLQAEEDEEKSAKQQTDELLMGVLLEEVLPKATSLYMQGPLQVGALHPHLEVLTELSTAGTVAPLGIERPRRGVLCMAASQDGGGVFCWMQGCHSFQLVNARWCVLLSVLGRMSSGLSGNLATAGTEGM